MRLDITSALRTRCCADNPDECNPALDPDVKQDFLNCLFHRLPTLPREGEIVGFSSMYTVRASRHNTRDAPRTTRQHPTARRCRHSRAAGEPGRRAPDDRRD